MKKSLELTQEEAELIILAINIVTMGQRIDGLTKSVVLKLNQLYPEVFNGPTGRQELLEKAREVHR